MKYSSLVGILLAGWLGACSSTDAGQTSGQTASAAPDAASSAPTHNQPFVPPCDPSPRGCAFLRH